MLTTAVVSILVVQHTLLCRKRAKYFLGGQRCHFLCLEWVIVINFRTGAQSYQLLVAAILDFFQNGHLRKWRNLLCFIFLIHQHEIFIGSGVWCDVLGMKESEYDVQMTFISVAEGYHWDLEVKSTKNSTFSHISCCQVTFQQQTVYENDFLKSSFLWMHLLPWPPHSICKMANHGMCDGKCHPSWLYLLQFFLQTSHIWTINKTLQNVFWDYVINIRGGHTLWAPYYIFKMALLWLILKIGNYLRYNRDFLYISVSKAQLCVHGHWNNEEILQVWLKLYLYIEWYPWIWLSI